MNNTFLLLTVILIVISVAMILIILVQRPQGGGLASAFGGAGGGGTDTVFGGRVGDALTVMTVITFVIFLGLAVSLNLVDSSEIAEDVGVADTTSLQAPVSDMTDHPTGTDTSNSDHPTNGAE